MTDRRDPSEMPGWYILFFIGLPVGIALWCGAISLAWYWLSSVGLIGQVI
ncbi:MAG: hypothetical protein RSB86_15380 [Comamonas sp.]